MLEIVRTLWRGEELTFHGRHFAYDGVQLAVTPQQDPLEVWLGGQVPAALDRCGRLGEGWMPGLCTPTEAAAARRIIEQAADQAGRTVDGEHFGVNIGWVDSAIDEQVLAQLRARRPDLAMEDLVAVGVDGLTERISSFVEVGFSKFVIRPADSPADWARAVERVADVVKLQS
jgi:alkanesulfonate monooxygenase SsuD/methylene tetrahydromethanopterin reductase-like flavin-dependent oxidoreductase (luciferase family)